MNRKRIIVLASVLAVVVALVLSIKSLTTPGSAARPEHLSITEVKAGKTGEILKVGGEIQPGSVSWDNSRQLLTFTLASPGDSLEVIYSKPAPEGFKPGAPLVAEGTMSNSGIFQATALTTQGSLLCKACHG